MSARVKLEPGSSGDHMMERVSGASPRICFVCGGAGAIYPLNSRPRERGSYFPFLEQHEIPHGACRPDADGVVVSCMLCYSFLGQQWESFERNRTPHSKRLYWLKRTDNGHYIGAEMRLQGEYASQVIGVSPEPGNRGPGAGHGHCFPMVNNSPMIATANAPSSRQSTPVNRVTNYSNSVALPTTSNSHHPHQQDFYRDSRESRPNSGTMFVQSNPNHNNDEVFESSLLDLRSGSNSSAMSAKDFKIKSQQNETNVGHAKTDSSSKQREPTIGNGALDLSMPDKNSSTEACYLCGEEILKGTLVSVYAKPISNCPFFPSLLTHPRPSKSYPMDHSGCVQACSPCYQYLLQQWDALQRQNVPHSERQYRLRKHSTSTTHYSPRMSQRPATSASISPHTPSPMLLPQQQSQHLMSHHSSSFICFLCGQEFAWNQRRILYSGPNSEGEQPLHFLERVKPSRGALPLSATGEALTCSSCYKAAHKQRHAYVDSLRTPVSNDESQQQHIRSQHHNPPPPPHHQQHQQPQHFYNQRQPDTDKHHREDQPHKLVCQICRQLVSRRFIKFVRSFSENGKLTYPLLVQNEDEGYSLCGTCYNNIIARWENSEENRGSQKHFSIGTGVQNEAMNRKVSNDMHRNGAIGGGGGGGHVNLDMTLRINVPTPDLDVVRSHQSQHSHSGSASLLTTIPNRSNSPVNLAYSHMPPSEASKNNPSSSTLPSNALDLSGSVSRSALVPLDASSSVHKKSRKSANRSENSFVCYVCGFHMKTGRCYSIRSYPLKSSEGIESCSTPFFPFLTMHLAPPDAEPVADDGTVITCTYCYHSLMEQWNAYESSASRNQQDRNPWSRQFNCTEYVCFVCGVQTYRKRVDSIRVTDFTFLLDHPRPVASLVLDSGESVVVCLVCFDTLSAQWHDFERMKVPIELRKYNCISSPTAPADNENITSGHSTVNGENRQRMKNKEENDADFKDLSGKDLSGKCRLQQLSSAGLVLNSKSSVQLLPSNKNNSNLITHHAQISPSGSSGIQSHNSGSNARTSSFAAALRKLAEQATDPVSDKELSPGPPANSPTPTSTKRGPPSLVLIGDSHSSSAASHIPSGNFTSPSAVPISSASNFNDGRKNAEKSGSIHSRSSGKGLYDDLKKMGYSSHRPQGDSGSEDGNRSGQSSAISRGCPPPLYGDRVDINSSPAKSTSSSYLANHQLTETKSSNSSYYSDRAREEQNYLSSRQQPSQPLHLRLLSPSWSHHTPTSTSSRLDDHIPMNSSFQPYRPTPEDLRHGISPHVPSSYDSTSPYGYHPAAFLPPQLQHPSFRFDDPLYLERCGMFRPSLFPLPHPGVLPSHHALPFYSGSRYTPELLPHSLGLVSPTGSQLLAQERLKMEEQRRDRTYEIFDQERESRNRDREAERESEFHNEVNGKEQDKRHRNSWSAGFNSESQGAGNIGSITQGIPRADLVSRASPARPIVPSPSLMRLPSAEIPAKHTKSPTEFVDRNEGKIMYSNSFNAKSLISSPFNREKPPSNEKEQFIPSRSMHYETPHSDVNENEFTAKKSSKSSGSRLKDSVHKTNSYNCNAPDNYTKTNHIVPEVIQSNIIVDNSRLVNATEETSLEKEEKHRKRGTVFYSNVNADGVPGKSLENENHKAFRTKYRAGEPEIIHPWDPCLRLSPRPCDQSNKCDQIVPVSKVFHDPLLKCDKLKSKLDLSAERVKLRKMNSQEYYSDEDDNSENEAIERLGKITIFSGPPLTLDISKEKLHFLSQIGLTSHKKRNELNLTKYLRQHRKSKNIIDVATSKSENKRSSVPWFLNDVENSSKYSLDELRSEPELSKKVQFFLNLNLNLVPTGKRDDNSKILQVVIEEKIRRNGYFIPNHTKEMGLPAISTIDETNSAKLSADNSTRGCKRKIDASASENSQPHPKTLAINARDRPTVVHDNHVKYDNGHTDQTCSNSRQENKIANVNSNFGSTETVNNQYKFGREFAQEFHESVWLQTNNSSKKSNAEADNILCNNSSTSDGNLFFNTQNSIHSENNPEFHVGWPGVEVLISAYHKHQQEQKLERDVLSEQCSRLLAQNRELNTVALNLNQKAADFISLKKSLNEDRRGLQTAIDSLKCFLKDLR